MTLEDLRDHGVLLPEDEWGAHRLTTTTRQIPLAIAFLLAAASLIVAYLADGGPLTWVGVAVFLVMLFAIIWMCDRAVRRQRRRMKR